MYDFPVHLLHEKKKLPLDCRWGGGQIYFPPPFRSSANPDRSLGIKLTLSPWHFPDLTLTLLIGAQRRFSQGGEGGRGYTI